jgi:hypothetical protein
MNAVVGRVDVQASHDGLVRVENGVRETSALSEVPGVALQVAEVLREAHLARPTPVGEAGYGADVVDARHPRRIVTVIVFRAKGLQAETSDREASRWLETSRNERAIVGHSVPTLTIKKLLGSGYCLCRDGRQ